MIKSEVLITNLPTRRELDLACAIIVRKSIRLFFGIEDSEATGPGEQRLLDSWHEVPQERRETALLEFERGLWEGFLEGLQASATWPLKRGASWHE